MIKRSVITEVVELDGVRLGIRTLSDSIQVYPVDSTRLTTVRRAGEDFEEVYVVAERGLRVVALLYSTRVAYQRWGAVKTYVLFPSPDKRFEILSVDKHVFAKIPQPSDLRLETLFMLLISRVAHNPRVAQLVEPLVKRVLDVDPISRGTLESIQLAILGKEVTLMLEGLDAEPLQARLGRTHVEVDAVTDLLDGEALDVIRQTVHDCILVRDGDARKPVDREVYRFLESIIGLKGVVYKVPGMRIEVERLSTLPLKTKDAIHILSYLVPEPRVTVELVREPLPLLKVTMVV